MPENNHPLLCEAYRGTEPFLFVSYAHKDGATVLSDIDRLNSSGYRIWYDEGIAPGNEWPDEIAKALESSALFVVFISSKSIESINVRNEINFALNKKKPFLAVYIENVTLPPGLELRMGDIQAIMKWKMSDENYFKKLNQSLPDSLMKRREISYAKGSVYQWRKVIDSGSGGEDVQVECIHCGLTRSYDPLLGDKPPDNCPACGFDGVKPSEGAWYATKSEGMGDRSYICRRCRNEIFVTHYESDFQVPTQCPKCGFSK